MLFSFIIPTYNNEDYLLECIDSIKKISNYTKQLIDVVIVDDGSYDNGSRFCDNLSLETNITVIHQINNGVSNARNRGIDIVNGDYIIFIDADDYIDSIKLANCLDIITNDNEIDMLVYGISFDYYHKNKIYRNNEIVPTMIGKKTIDDCLKNINVLFDSNSLSSLCTRIVKREIIEDERLCETLIEYEDLEYSLRILKNCNYLYFVNHPVYRYRQIASHSDRLKKIDNIDIIVDKISDNLKMINCDVTHIGDMVSNDLSNRKLNTMGYKELKDKYPNNSFSIYFKRKLRKIRHKIAEFIKCNFGDFRK